MTKVLNSLLIVLQIVVIAACKENNKDVLYSSSKFTVYSDRVEQEGYKAVALSEDKLASDYQSPANAFFNPQISYKFSINGGDNEAPSGQDHQAILIVPENGTITIRTVFGQKDVSHNVSGSKENAVPANTPVRFEVDMKKVLSDFDKYGYYTSFKGEKIYKSDFKGVWIAGGTAPLSWDFENLPGRPDLQLTDPDGDGIFTCDLVFNVYNPAAHTSSEKTITADLSAFPSFMSPFPLMNALYRLSLQEMLLDVRPDSTFMAGKKWNGVWTRDISYSIILALAAIEPEVARNSLMYKVKNGMIIQDTGSGGSWPVSTDREVWSLAAWEVYKSTGDINWLSQAYKIICKSVENDFKVAFDTRTGLFYGESSFLDWRKQTYPLWMEPIDIYNSHNLGTNAIFYKTLTVLDEMGKVLGIANDYGKKAVFLKNSINKYLWLEEKGYYSQYLYGHYSYSLSPRSESLGEALCILYNIPSGEREKRMFSSVPVMDYGIPCIYPQIPGIPPYHNNAVWPFVQAYWTWAGAMAGNSRVVEHGIASIYRQSALFLTNKENMVAESGDFNGTEINSDYQLWSVAANLAVVYRIVFGLDYESDRLVFRPFVPESFKGSFELNGLKYRNAVLDIRVEGFGDGIALFFIDGVKVNTHRIPEFLTGKHSVVIKMNGKIERSSEKLSESRFSPETPEPEILSGKMHWKVIRNAEKYIIVRNGKTIGETRDTTFNISDPGEYQVMAADNKNFTSFLSKPLPNKLNDSSAVAEAENFGKPSGLNLSGFSGSGFVELNKDSPAFVFDLDVPSDGNYIVEFRYSNGNGPVNTDNKCAQRSLFCDGVYYGTAVFPQRGKDEWSNWGMSNPLVIHLKKGRNRLELRFEEYNSNMNVEENSFVLDFVRCFSEEKAVS